MESTNLSPSTTKQPLSMTDHRRTELIQAVAEILHLQIIEGQSSTQAITSGSDAAIFDEEIYINARPDEFSTKRLAQLRAFPTAEEIFEFLNALYGCAQLRSECWIVALIYLNRFIAFTETRVHATNWRPLFLCSLVIAQKVCDESYLTNDDFAYMYPFFNTEEITSLEEKFLELIKYNFDVSARIYSNYLTNLRKSVGNRTTAALSPEEIITAKKIEMRSKELKTRVEAVRKEAQFTLSFPGGTPTPKTLSMKVPLKLFETS